MKHKDIEHEVQNLWEKFFSDAMCEPKNIREYASFMTEIERKAEFTAKEHLQPWLTIFETSIHWLSHISVVLDQCIHAGTDRNDLRSVWALVGASCAHAVAVRRLVLSGLDTPARAVLRCLDEHLMACLVMLDDSAVAQMFHASQDPKESRAFWHRYLQTKELRKRLSSIERKMDLSEEISVVMRAWRDEEIQMYSQAIHPSFLSAALAVKTPVAGDPEKYAIAILGQASAASERTLNFACKTIWYFSRVADFLLLNDLEKLTALFKIEMNELHQTIIVGRNVIHELNRRYWDYKIHPF